MALGVVHAIVTGLSFDTLSHAVGLGLPTLELPTTDDLWNGALLLALPQIPLSLGNSVIATSQTAQDLYPQARISVRRIGFTYALMNLTAPLFGGVPTCHGCGGMVGFHVFGARTGGAPVLYGAMYVVLGLVFGPGIEEVVRVFPLPILGVVLVFESIALMSLVRDVSSEPPRLWVALAVALCIVALPYGYGVGLLLGSALSYAMARGLVLTPNAELAKPRDDP
jgi:MFS superfamily sulfate permease-like transporter